MVNDFKFGNVAMIVGAAEGLGRAFAHELAQRGYNLVLADIQEMKLDKLAQQIRTAHAVKVSTLTIDLADTEAPDILFRAWENEECGFLVYNAAYGPVRDLLGNTEDELSIYIDVNIRTTQLLVFRILKAAGSSPKGIMFLSSLAGFRGTRQVIPYAGTKAFLWNFAEGCHYEFEDSPYVFSVCCPGATATPNYTATKPHKTLFMPTPAPPQKVARYALNRFGKQVFIIPGFSNRVVHFIFTRLLPRRWASGLHNSTMKKMYVTK
jgi:short-subunit dehydrogenase